MKIENRRARYDYEFLETWTAGMALVGSEVKSFKSGAASLVGAWCELRGGEVFCREMQITPLSTAFSHAVVRERKLLLTNKEIKKMERMMDKGLSIIPVSAFVNERGLIKMQIAIARGKKNWDKRETIKKRDLSRG
jgi:SsrA-binding protein